MGAIGETPGQRVVREWLKGLPLDQRPYTATLADLARRIDEGQADDRREAIVKAALAWHGHINAINTMRDLREAVLAADESFDLRLYEACDAYVRAALASRGQEEGRDGIR